MPTHRLTYPLTPLFRQVFQLVQKITNGNKHSQNTPECYLTGGAVRDIILKIPPKDVDIEIYNLTQQELASKLRKIYTTHNIRENTRFGTWEIFTPSGTINISLPRLEVYYGPHHTDVAVTLYPRLPFKQALHRRDFTINALLANLRTGELLDPYKGVGDIATRTLRAVNPTHFSHDALRAWRAVQLTARYQLAPTAQLFQLLVEMAQSVPMTMLSGERIHGECDKLFMPYSHPSMGLELAKTTGLLAARIPSLERLSQQTEDWQTLTKKLDTLVLRQETAHACWRTIIKALNKTECVALIQELKLPKKYLAVDKITLPKRHTPTPPQKQH